MKLTELQYFLASLILLIFSFENIYLNLVDIFFNNRIGFELLISLILSLFVFIIGHVIVVFNRHIKFENCFYVLKCIYIIFLLYISVYVFSDVIKVWVYMFYSGVHISDLNLDNKHLIFTFVLCFFVLLFMLLLKTFNLIRTANKMENDMINLKVSLLRIIGILIIANFILYINFIYKTINEILSTNHQFYIIPIVVFFLFPIIVGALMIIDPYSFSKKIKYFPNINNKEYNLNDILGICIILLGIYFLINSAIMIIIEFMQVLIINLKMNTEKFLDEKSISFIFGYITKIIVGLLFIFKGMRISDYIVNKR